jgi:hypothetical protein
VLQRRKKGASSPSPAVTCQPTANGCCWRWPAAPRPPRVVGGSQHRSRPAAAVRTRPAPHTLAEHWASTPARVHPACTATMKGPTAGCVGPSDGVLHSIQFGGGHGAAGGESAGATGVGLRLSASQLWQ